jgi:hypothetical protein
VPGTAARPRGPPLQPGQPWQRALISRAARIHFGMIFGPSVREVYAEHAAELTSYTRRFVEESDAIGKEEFVAGLELEGRIYAPLGVTVFRVAAAHEERFAWLDTPARRPAL